MKNYSTKNLHAFTLVEMMITVAVAAILIAVAAPNFIRTIESNTILSITDELSSSLRLSREEALRQGLPVTICASSNQSTCGGTWNDGWIVFVDKNSNANLENGEEIIAVTQQVAQNYPVTLLSPITSAMRFNSQGFAPEKGTFRVCNPSANNTMARGVIIHASGGARHAADTNDDSIREDHNGANFSC